MSARYGPAIRPSSPPIEHLGDSHGLRLCHASEMADIGPGGASELRIGAYL
jgi:hypothetical protein